MKDSFGLNLAEPALIGANIADAAWRGTERLPRPMMLTLMTVAAVVLCAAHAAVAGANTARAAGIGYLSFALVLLGCALCFWTRARSAKGALHVRWSLIAAAALAAAIGYIPSFTQFILNTPSARVLQTVCFNASEALYMLAAVLFFAGVARSIVLVDLLQALLFILLRFNLVYSPVGRDQFTLDHLIVGQFMALFLFLVAMVACLGASSRGEVNFLKTLSWFFGLRLIVFFLSNQVSYTWQHYINCSLWDVPGTALLAGFSLYMLSTSGQAEREAADPAPLASSLLVRSLMPSFLALVNVMLGLFLLRTSVTLTAVAMSISLVCYVVRTALLQAQAMHEKTMLQIHNEHLKGLVVLDPLTGIGNRRSLADAYSRLQAGAAGERLSLLLADIDYFKEANDSHGHQHGDQVLIALAKKLERLAASVAGSHCVRMGGDEFALLLPFVTSQTACALADELRTMFSAHKFATEGSKVSLSIGIASREAACDVPLETLLRCADEALYRAKRRGRNCVEMQCVRATGSEADCAAPGAHLELRHIAS